MQAKENKLYRTFVKGLVTEASFLTYPEDASYDELNTILYRKGNRTRRLGINYSGSGFHVGAEENDYTIARNEFVWKAVGNKPNINFLVLQVGSNVYVYDMNEDQIPASLLTTIDLTNYLRSGSSAADLETDWCQFASGKGFLFIVNDNIEPLSVEYDDPSFTTTKIKILIRDFDGLDDNLQNEEEPSTLSKNHHYNLQNQGWVTTRQSVSTFSPVALNGYTYVDAVRGYSIYDYQELSAYQGSTSSNPIFIFKNAIGRYPGNNKQWWVARAEADDDEKKIKAGDFLPEVLNKLFSGNNRAPRGHYILDAFKKDRSAVSGISDIDTEVINNRPNTVSFFSGRVWYACNSTVYYSQIIDNTGIRKAGLCYQEADPTAEDISELIPTDGGVVPIPEADKIVRLLPMANGVVVFALNGVWFVSGGDSAFSATNISVSKVSPIGTSSPLSCIETDGLIFWWSEVGIQALEQASGQFGPIPGKFGNTNISEQTIQTYFNETIPDVSKPYVKGVYDTRNNTLLWLFRDEDFEDDTYRYNNILLFDLTLQAFYPWKISSFETQETPVAGPGITGIFLGVGFAENIVEEAVTASGVIVTAGGGEIVTSGISSTVARPSNIFYVTNVPGDGLTLSQTDYSGNADWPAFDGNGIAYDSYVETGFEIHNDAMRKKQIVYLFAHFAKNSDSSCRLTTKWDWSNKAFSNKWSNEFEAYRERTRPDPTTADIENGFDVITSKNKIRGRGTAVQFRFGTNEIGKQFDLLGWSVAYSGNTEP